MNRRRDPAETDRCPGALQVHRAADGALVRVRLPGGVIAPAQLEALALAAAEFGSSAMELTSRGNVQLRAVVDTEGLADAIAAAGLLPSATHERVRNVIASPLSGRRGGNGDVRPLVARLDAGLQGRPRLAELPGRFWFGLDDGRGDVSGLDTDVGAHLLADGGAALVIAGVDTGVRMAVDDVVSTLLRVAEAFLDVHGSAWRAAELDDVGPLVAGLDVTALPGATWPHVTRPPVGWITQDDGLIALGAAVPLGVLPARTAQFLAAIEAPLVITPWRSVLVCDLDEGVADTVVQVLAPLGLVFDENSPWLEVSSCTGSPGCERSAADVRSDAAAAAAAAESVGVHRHYVGCDRACGSPPVGEVLVAGPTGYRGRRSDPPGPSSTAVG